MVAILSIDPRSDGVVFQPGQLGESWSDWAGGTAPAGQSEGEGPPLTTLTGTVDQAARHSLVRLLDSLGLPLLSVLCVECASEESTYSR